ncbi:MAG: zinc ribbon domain-containing protein [Clostridiales Family XIII bacterium]|jgi:hypothetical protein|nr:zinc ribbon domain-containing protein [Clostridiales Family XIII bacterium]
MLDKIIDGVNKGVAAVANKSEEYVEIAKLKSQISVCAKSRDEKKLRLGEFVYEMFGSGNYDNDAINAFCVEIRSIEDEIATSENAITEIQNASRHAAAGGGPQRACPSCGGLAPASAKFCTGCGAALPPPEADGVTCQCGAVNMAEARFCVICGSALAQAAPPPSEEQSVTCSCGLLNKPGAKFCRACGNTL